VSVSEYYSRNRVAWEDFYDSERAIISGSEINANSNILDIGCGCGGLGLALTHRFSIANYLGIDLDDEAINVARKLNSSGIFESGDFLQWYRILLKSEKKFSHVFSLSCADWSDSCRSIIAAAWDLVAPGGSLILSTRIVPNRGCDDISISYQYSNLDGTLTGPRVPYVVMGVKDFAELINVLNPEFCHHYAFDGTPSDTAVTPFQSLTFNVSRLTKAYPSKIHDAQNIRHTFLRAPKYFADQFQRCNS